VMYDSAGSGSEDEAEE
jgi:hypothetical protein